MTEQKKETLFGCVKGADGLYHSEFGDVFTEKQLRSGAYGCLLMMCAVVGLAACAVTAIVDKVNNPAKKEPKIEQKQKVDPAVTNAMHFMIART